MFYLRRAGGNKIKNALGIVGFAVGILITILGLTGVVSEVSINVHVERPGYLGIAIVLILLGALIAVLGVLADEEKW